MQVKKTIVTTTMAAFLVGGATLAQDVNAGAKAPKPAPINSNPRGQSYNEWSAEWWQWVLETPFADNPLVTGECSVRDGDVAFLIGALGGGETDGQCTVSTGTAIFFPIANSFYGAFPDDPPEQRTEEFVRDQNACAEQVSSMSVTIDGKSVSNPEGYFQQSVLFDVVMPADNIFGLPEGFVIEPSADAGHYLFLRPLPPGDHTIEWTASTGCDSQDASWLVTVEPGN